MLESGKGRFLPPNHPSMDFLHGKKTYIIGTLTVLYGVLGITLGHIDQATAIQLVLNGLGIAALRNGVARASR